MFRLWWVLMTAFDAREKTNTLFLESENRG